MRIDPAVRPFPFTCLAVRKSSRQFFSVVGLSAFVGLNVFLVFNSLPEERFAPPYFALVAGMWLCVLAEIPIHAGFREVFPNWVVVTRRSTWVTPKLVPVELLMMVGMGVSGLASGVLVIRNSGGMQATFEGGALSVTLGPVVVCLGAALALSGLWQQLRCIRMTPEAITYWRGIGRITLAWDEIGDVISTNDVRDHEGYRKYLDRYLPGGKVVVPVERVMDVKLRVHWEDVNTPRLLLETDHFAVEASALLTAILALRDNPELRPLLGTRASRVLFIGPPWWVRRHLYRTQQWWPKGQAPDGIAVDAHGVVKEFG